MIAQTQVHGTAGIPGQTRAGPRSPGRASRAFLPTQGECQLVEGLMGLNRAIKLSPTGVSQPSPMCTSELQARMSKPETL